MKESTDDNKE